MRTGSASLRRASPLFGALLLLLLTQVAPRLPLTRPAYDILFVIDITGSMNVRDMQTGVRTVSRLEAAKAAMRGALARLPCESRAGMAVFTERRPFLLFEPAELCTGFPAVDGAIAGLDWRMAWEGDSHIATALDRSVLLAADLGAGLVFMTDGHEAPPLPGGALPGMDSRPGTAPGLVVGVGGTTASPIPKFDEAGREIGFYGPQDVPHESRIGPPPESAHLREGWHPRNAPYGGEATAGAEHLSSRRDDHLRALAAATGLVEIPLVDGEGLAAAVRAAIPARAVASSVDVRPYLAGLALALLVAAHGPDVLASIRRFRRRVRPAPVR